jgi:hypothetical protein
MKQIMEEREDIVFFIKMLSLKKHSEAYRKAKSIVCEKSLWILERALDGKRIREPRCETTELEDNRELAMRLGITGTPTIILPDGGIVSGYRDAETLVGLIVAAFEEMYEEAARAAEGEDLLEEQPEDVEQEAPAGSDSGAFGFGTTGEGQEADPGTEDSGVSSGSYPASDPEPVSQPAVQNSSGPRF